VGHVTTLWDIVWSNVLDAGVVGEPIDAAAPPDDERWARIFPWLAETRTSENDSATLPEDDTDLLQCFFGMPRRIRLIINGGTDGECDLDDLSGNGMVRSFRTTNYGVMYAGWQHPLSPYYVDKSKGKLPFHPQPGLVTYEDWMAWWGLRDGVPARNVQSWKERMDALTMRGGVDLAATRERGLWAVGFDMDNMKARGFLDERIPYFEPRSDDAEWAKRFQDTVTRLVAGARETASQLQYELRRARYAKRDGDSFKLLDNAPKSAFEDVAAQLWRDTETEFRDALKQLHEGDPTDVTFEVRRKFHNLLRKTALRLFDDACEIDTLADQDAKRLVDARAALLTVFSANGKVAKALDIVEAKPAKPRKDGNRPGKRGKRT
jgi:CRISPR system Cascade subunit CasA